MQLRRLFTDSAARATRCPDAVFMRGAAAGVRLLEAAQTAGLKIVITYGMMKTCDGYVYDGSPIGNTRVAIENGRIVLSGSAMALGYVEGPNFTEMFRTSDIGRLEAGRLIVLGRAGDAITTSGMAIIPVVVEEALAYSGAGENVVVGIDDDEWDEMAVTVVGTTRLSRLTASKMHKAIAEEHGKAYVSGLFLSFPDLRLSDPGHSKFGPSGPRPSGIGFGGLPLTAPGKLDRRAIRELARCALDHRSPSSWRRASDRRPRSCETPP